MSLAIAAVLLIVFVVNVVLGSTGGTAIFGTVGEMLLLFATSIVFVAGVLKREADAEKRKKDRPTDQ
jgi:hypothetical protein